MAERPRSVDLTPGTRLRVATNHNHCITLQCRKEPDDGRNTILYGSGYPFAPGWWVEEGGGISDSVFDEDDSIWEIIPEPVPAVDVDNWPLWLGSDEPPAVMCGRCQDHHSRESVFEWPQFAVNPRFTLADLRAAVEAHAPVCPARENAS